jgi:exportin-1
METYVRKAEDLDTLYNNFIPPLLEAVLGDYNRNVPHARDAEVLNVMATITTRLQALLTPQVPAILDAVFECTLEMISKDFAEYPEHRAGFFKLLRAMDMYCFPALLSLPALQFKLLFDSVIWAIKHTMRDIADTGLNLLLEIINNFAAAEEPIANAFFQQYYLSMLQDNFFVLTDSDHKSGFKHQSLILQRLFQLVESNAIHAPLFDPSTQSGPPPSNQQFLREYTASLLKNAFPHLQPSQIQSFIIGLCETCNDIAKFKLLLRDFLISLRESSSDDNAELYLEEKEAEQQRKVEEERANAERVPGLLKPSQIKEEDEEL